jgi:hypothetical protein
LTKDWRAELNPDGSKGKIAQAFAALVGETWSERTL